MTKVNLNNLAEKDPISLDGLQIVKARFVNGRIVCDIVNREGEMVVSGEAEWVIDICYQRDYYIENWNEAINNLDLLASSWGTY